MRPKSPQTPSGSEQKLAIGQLPRRAEKYVLYAVAALIVLTGSWISLGKFQQNQNADSIVPVLVSLQHWKPFYWETNRYGMLVPLLAIPFRHPLVNLIFQSILGTCAGLACSFLLVAYFFEASIFWLTAAALQNIWLLLLVSQPTQFDWFVGQCYGVSFALAFAALILAEKKKTLLALGLMILCHWVNSAAFVVLIPLVLQCHLIDRQKRGLFRSLGVVLAGAACGLVFMFTARYQSTLSGLVSRDLWIPGWLALLHTTQGAVLTKPVFVWWMVVPAALGIIATLLPGSSKRPLLVSLAFVDTAVLYWLFVGALAWTRANMYVPRYIYPALFLLSTAAALAAVAPLQRIPFQPRLAALAAAALMFVAGVFAFGRPSVSGVERDLHQRFGSLTAEVLASHAPIITGGYWIVWPAVFDANLTLYEQRERRKVYGFTYRGGGTSPQWARQKVCMDSSLHDPEARNYMDSIGRHFHLEQTFGTINMYCEN
jgi:hypothetical protein